MGEVPKTPEWARWVMKKMLPPEEVRAVLDELHELHGYWSTKEGPAAADRRYR